MLERLYAGLGALPFSALGGPFFLGIVFAYLLSIVSPVCLRRKKIIVKAGDRIPVIAAIGTANPPVAGDNDFFMKICDSMNYPEDVQKTVAKIVAKSGITRRLCCIPNPDPATFMAQLESGRARAQLWEQWAPRMAVDAAREALSRWPAGSACDVTHVVTHSCTGFSAPGLDLHLIRELGLPADTRKLGVNFMGCFGAFTALYVAKQIIEADATGRAVVLVACAEVCTSHVQRDERVEIIVGQTLFADGAACAVVAHAGFAGRDKSRSAVATDEWAIGDMANEIIPNTAGSMTWKQGGAPGQYDMWLDRSIPSALKSFFFGRGLSLGSRVGIPSMLSCAWAIHPGGRAIIESFEDTLAKLAIKGEGLNYSREVLANYGNMSSPTILFVLQRVLANTAKDDVFCAGFGPGLSIEFGRLYRVKNGGRR